MRTLGRLVFALVALATIVGGGTAAWMKRWLHAPATTEAFTWEVTPGDSLRTTLRTLHDVGAVEGSWEWDVLVRARRIDCLQAGSHTFAAGLTPREVIHTLCRTTRRATVRVTIREGENVWQVAARLAEAGLAVAPPIAARATDPVLAAELGVPASTLEGWLFPDTYEFYVDTPPDAALRRMVERARSVHDEVFGEGPEAVTAPVDVPGAAGLDRAALITLASLVEKEAQVGEERPRIARVFYNRLHLGMRLETDPTCVYGADTWHEIPTRSRCRDVENVWSTYVNSGLPPGPIANPGRASLRAVLAPSDEPDLLFFVALPDGSGRHAFAATYAEHQENVRRWRER